jgi:hypothetical protein
VHGVRGFITERDFANAECEFPGICAFYAALAEKPMTFLELVWSYIHAGACEAAGEETGAKGPSSSAAWPQR